MLKINETRFLNFFEELKQFNATPNNGYTRRAFSEEDLNTIQWLEETLKEYDLYSHTDSVKNVFGQYGDKKPYILIGSHLDTVQNGGLYDGALGVLAALEILITLKEKNIDLPFSVKLVAFRAEEANRLGGTFGSHAFTGKIDYTERFLKDIKTTDLTEEDVRNAHCTDDIKAYLELHIEQGAVLEQKNIDIGIVTAIAGLRLLNVKVTGKSDHAGTTPMNMREDALKKATQLLSKIYDFSETLDNNSVLTVGELNVFPNQSNVIPNEVNFFIDFRSNTNEKMDECLKELSRIITEENQMTVDISAKPMDSNVIEGLERTSTELGYSNMRIVSGAGHDANTLSEQTPTGMIFVPSKDGISHHPDEYTSEELLVKGANVMLNYIKSL